MGVKKLRKIQIGLESTAGTAVAATDVWRGSGTLEDTREMEFVEEETGLLVPPDRLVTTALAGGLTLEGVATFEQLPFILTCAVEKLETGVQDGAGTDYIYQYDIPTASPTWSTATIEGGDDAGAEEANYAFVKKFSLEAGMKETVKLTSEWMTREVTPSSFTGALSLTAVEELVFGKGKIYLDAIGGTFGTTQVSNSILGLKIEYESGLLEKNSADGRLDYSYLVNTGPVVTGTLTWEHNSSAISEKVNWRAKTARKLQIKIEGGAISTPGTTYSVKTFLANLPIKWTKFNKIDEIDGNDIVEAEWEARYNLTAATAGQFIVVNELSAL